MSFFSNIVQKLKYTVDDSPYFTHTHSYYIKIVSHAAIAMGVNSGKLEKGATAGSRPEAAKAWMKKYIEDCKQTESS